MLRLGILSTLVGPYQIPGEDGIRGAKLALQEHGYNAGGHDIELEIEATNAMSSSAIGACEDLMNKDIKLIVGPLSGDEAIGVRSFANKHPDCTFVCGSAGSQPMFNPAENFFMFNPTGAQMLAGLGKFCYEKMGFRRVATIGEAYSFPFAQIGGFGLDFIKAGGKISKYIWCALGTQNYSEYIEQIPDDVDAIFSSLGGTDGIFFLEQFRNKRSDLPLIAGTIFADQSLLGVVQHHADLLTGVVSASSHADNIETENAQKFVEAYHAAYPKDGFYLPSYFAYAYYANMKALLLALDAIDGDLSRVQDTLRTLKFETPTSSVHLDHHRVAVMDIYVNEIRQTDDGNLYTHMLQRVPQASCTFGMSDEEFSEVGKFGVHTMPGMKKKSFEDIVREAKERGKRKNKPD